MPWCEQCAKFWNPSSMTAEGDCPTCGRPLGRPEGAAAVAPGSGADPAATTPGAASPVPAPGPTRLTGADLRELAGEDAKAPWHFKLMVAALVAYLGWRVVELVVHVIT